MSPVVVDDGVTSALYGKSVVSVACGYYQCVAFTPTNDLIHWGTVYKSISDFSTGTSRNIPTPQLSPKGSIGSRLISSVMMGSNHVLILTNDRSLHAWGYNDIGQIGDSTISKINYNS
jgi:alpha-tubulin suppressor-like RCC1 family protein